MRVALGALMHESNTFAPGRTTLEDFRRTQFLTGADIVEAHAGTGSEVGGALEELARRSVEVVPTFPIHPVEEAVRMGRAVPGRPVVLNELADCTLGGASGDVVSTGPSRGGPLPATCTATPPSTRGTRRRWARSPWWKGADWRSC